MVSMCDKLQIHVHGTPDKINAEKKVVSHFYTYIYIALALALFLLIVIIVQNHSRFPPIGYKIVAVVIAIFLLLHVEWLQRRI
jgi:hypothetical protein